MKKISTILFTALAGYVHLSAAIGDATYYGCFNSSGSLKTMGDDNFQSRGKCRETCVKDPGYSVQAMTNSTLCLCGNYLPNSAYKVDDSKCKQGCPGFVQETCGTRLGEYFSVYLSGLEVSPDQDPVSSSSSSSATSTTATTGSVSTTSHSAATPTSDKSVSSSSAPPEPKKSVDKAGVAAGVVVGVLAVLGIGLGLFLFIRRRKRQQVEEEYKRSVAAREFAKKPQQDHRLDPAMIQRRDSVGSIADNQDYSRRILKVTNPDDR